MQTLPTTTQESTMHIPPTVLGIILDTGNTKEREALKTLTQEFLRLVPGPHVVSTFLIATADGVAYLIGTVTAETFAREWKEVYWGKQSDVTLGLQAMRAVMREYSKGNTHTPAFRALLLTDSPPTEEAAFHTALQALEETVMTIGVIGTGETQRLAGQAFGSSLLAIGHHASVSIEFIDQEAAPAQSADSLFRSLD